MSRDEIIKDKKEWNLNSKRKIERVKNKTF